MNGTERVPGAFAAHHFQHSNSYPALPPFPQGLCGTRRGARKSQGCLQTGVLGIPPGWTCRAGDKRLRSAPGQYEGRQWPRQPPGSTPRAAPEPRPGQGLLCGSGPSRPPRASKPPGGHGEKGWGPRAAGWGRLPQRLDSPSVRLEGCRQGPPRRPKASEHGTAPRHSHLEPQPPLPQHGPGGSSLSCQPPSEGTGEAPGAAAKPPTPEGAVVAAAAEAQHPPSRIEHLGRRSEADPGGAPPSRARRARLRWDNRGAAGGDPPRSLQRRPGRSCRRRLWATAPPGPHAGLRREDCGGRPGSSLRERRRAEWGRRGRRAPCTAHCLRSAPEDAYLETETPRSPGTLAAPATYP